MNRIRPHIQDLNVIGKLADLKEEHYRNTLLVTSMMDLLIEKGILTRDEIEAKNRAERELREANFRAELEKLQMQRELDESRMRQAAIIHSLPIILYLEAETCSPRVPRFVGGNFEAVTGFPFAAVEANPNLGAQIVSGPMSYEVDGKQYVSVIAGVSLVTFGLRE